MRRLALFLALLLAFLSPLPVMAQAVSEPDKSAIEQTITGQLEAFKRDDGTTAYGYAAPNIQQMFPSVERFMEMVKQGYQPVYRPKNYTFRDLALKDGRLAQTVEIVGPDNDYWTAVYMLEKQADGQWRITGCYIVKSEGGSA